MPRLMRPPRSPSLPSAARTCLVDPEGIEPSSPGCRPGILPLNDEPILARTTGVEPVLPRRQRGVLPFDYVPLRMVPRWSARGDSNPDLHGLNVPRLPIAPRAELVGPSGWTRTTTTRVKSPACCVDTTEGLERMTGFEPVPQGLEGPWATVTPHSLWIGGVTGRLSCQRPRPFELVGSKGFEPNRSWGRTGLRPVGGPSAPYCPSGDSARSRTRTHELWRLGCSRYTTLPTSSHVSTVAKTHPPSSLARVSPRARDQNKKGLLGDRPRRPGSLDECRPFRALRPPCRYRPCRCGD